LLKSKSFWLILVGLSILIFTLYQSYLVNNQNILLHDSHNKITKQILVKEKSIDRELSKVKNILQSSSIDSLLLHYTTDSFEENNNGYFIFDNTKLDFWTTNRIPIPLIYDSVLFNKPLVSLKNGWYLCKQIQYKNYTVVGLSLVQNNFPYENVYLENSFTSDFNVNTSVQLKLELGDYKVYDSQKRFLFTLFIDEDKVDNDVQIIGVVFGFLVSFSLLVWGLLLLVVKYLRHNRWIVFGLFTFFAFLIVVGRYFMFVNHWPTFITQSKFFSPIYFASSEWMPSLGDVLINSFLLFLIALLLKKAFHFLNIKQYKLRRWIRIPLTIFIIGVQFFIYHILVLSIKSLVFNSSISFNNESIFNYGYLHYLCFILIDIWLLLFVYLSYNLLKFSHRITSKKRLFWLLLLILISLFTFVNYGFLIDYIPVFYYFIGYYIIIGFFIYKQFDIHKGVVKFVLLLFFSLFVTQLIGEYYRVKEQDERKLLAEKLGTQHDPITEYRLDEISELIDNNVSDYLDKMPKNESKLLDYLDRTYFNTFTSKYKTSATLCKQNQILHLQPDNYKVECASFFKQKVANVGTPTKFANIWFMNYAPGQISYLLIVDLFTSGDEVYQLYIELDSKMYVTDTGYPDLLIDKKQKGVNRDFSRYAYARYVKNDLVNQFGKYSYSIKLDYYKSYFSNHEFFDFDGYNHLYYIFNQQEQVLLSKRNPTFFEKIANVSYFFLLYGIILLLISLIYLNLGKIIQNRISFRLRMQISMIVIILVSFVLIGPVTIRYFLTLNNKKNVEFVNEKIHSILIEFENQLSFQRELSNDMVSQINQMVFKMSERYFVDINVYDAAGQLIASSRPQMYQQGLLLDKMNSEAIFTFKTSKKTIYLHDEFIGKQKYWSVYMPYLSGNGEVMMYINMPYFAKQKELNSQISSFAVTFISVYLFIIFITVLIALVLARYISRPLLLIKERMSKMQLGDRNEKIEWNSTDEIGNLVEVYNTMVDELRQSAELLASSQREQAWREMAQQVAHEIKNPLTPMKLSVQMLHRTWKNGDTDWEQRLNQFSSTLIEQIDTLADIASSFSNFAKMPQGNLSNEDLYLVTKSVVSLHTLPQAKIHLNAINYEEYPIRVDKNQLIRVFNNLIKNALQSLKPNHQGIINITIRDYDDHTWLIEIEDNGSGISDEVKERIFSPNFTTKSSGMGLGLAMVKNIIVDFGGNIWFDSIKDKGTTFSFTLPKIQKVD